MKTRYDLAAEMAREAIEELRLAAYEQGYKDATHDLTAKAPKSSQDIRDEIIAKAKRDVSVLCGKVKNAAFSINRDKRTVVAYSKRKLHPVFARPPGIAKCDPSDCFNVHIGKAIALRRALGLEVPAEYLKAPQPTEVRVGDVIEFTEYKDLPHVVDKNECDFVSIPVPNIDLSYAKTNAHKIIDDSRD